ncbi:MAG: alpha-galactosidase [Clostridia bacterium]|nr:alpha-galactosidase [Clostridia bacterium]
MKSILNAHGGVVVRGKNGSIDYIDVGGGQPLPDVYTSVPFRIEYAVYSDSCAPVYGGTEHFRFVQRESRADNGDEFMYESQDGCVRVCVIQTEYNGLYTQFCRVVNIGSGRLCIKQIYNFFNAIDVRLLGADYARDAELGILRNEWGAEAQLYWLSPHEAGVIRPTGHKTGYAAEISSTTCWSTKRQMPQLYIRDKVTGHVWCMQHLPNGPYSVEPGLCDTERVQGSCFCIGAGTGTSERHGFRVYCEHGETYESCMSVLACADSFDELSRIMTDWRRVNLFTPQPLPLMFNDYMNCLWTRQDEENCKALIDVAHESGAEGYCFDDGWYREIGEHGLTGLGDWVPAKHRFGKLGLGGMIDYIRKKGMTAGLWTELEVCSVMAQASKLPDDCFLQNEGERIFRSNRMYFDFRNKKVREHLLSRIDALYALGIRYIKNDYNGHPGSGVDWNGRTPTAGLEAHQRAVNAFYAEVRATYPDLILENCASGAMRSDGATNRNFRLQSVSDCEEYEKMPSVLTGTLLSLLPEQVGVWAYPYPRIFWEMNGDEYLSLDYVYGQADGEQTIFNMVSGMMGAMYLSGKIDRADKENLQLIKQATDLYKRLRSQISRSYPFYPLSPLRVGERGYCAVGLRDGEEGLLAVWRIEKGAVGDGTVTLPIENIADVREIYPGRNFRIQKKTNAVTIIFRKPIQAVLLRITYATDKSKK